MTSFRHVSCNGVPPVDSMTYHPSSPANARPRELQPKDTVVACGRKGYLIRVFLLSGTIFFIYISLCDEKHVRKKERIVYKTIFMGSFWRVGELGRAISLRFCQVLWGCIVACLEIIYVLKGVWCNP